MSRAQRLLLVIVLLSLALYLHVSYVQWMWREYTNAGARLPLIAWTTKLPQGRTMTGLYARHDLSESIWRGVVIPVSLTTAAIYLILGARRSSRIQRGLCINCGYDLQGRGESTPTSKCPECGVAIVNRKS